MTAVSDGRGRDPGVRGSFGKAVRRTVAVFWLVAAGCTAGPGEPGDSGFIISYWTGPRSDLDPDKVYAEVAEAGFTTAMQPIDGFDSKINAAVLEACRRHGLNALVCDPRITARHLFERGVKADDPALEASLDEVVAEYSKHPAARGYFVADEPTGDMIPLVAKIGGRLAAKDPARVTFVNLLPDYFGGADREWGAATYEAHVERVCVEARPGVLSFDFYPIMANHQSHPRWWENLEVIRRQGLKHAIPIGLVLQLTGGLPGRTMPTDGEVRWQVFAFVAYGGRALMYFTYWNQPGNPLEGAPMTYEGTRTGRFDLVKRINGELRGMAPTLMKLASTDVLHSEPVPRGCRGLGGPVRIEGGPAVLGMFKHENGSTWAVLVNRSFARPAELTVRFEGTVQVFDSRTRELGPIEVAPVTLALQAGEGRLLKLSVAGE